MGMKIIRLNQGKYQENSYVCLEGKQALVIDPGNPLSLLKEAINQAEVVGIYLTHGHSDHTAFVDDLLDLYPQAKLYGHSGDEALMDRQTRFMEGYPIFHDLEALEEGIHHIGDFEVEVIWTPGHSMGSSCLRIKDALFTGDTLFKGTVGRSDLFGGNEETLFQSLAKLKGLDPSLKVYPGHEDSSTLAMELKTNPFLR